MSAFPIRRYQSGLSLLELMVTVSLLAIIAAIAIPAFKDLIETQKSNKVIRQLYGLIQKSRHYAITHNSNVILCKSTDFSSCGGSWKDGIIVFTDLDGDRAVNGDDTLLRTVDAPFEQGTLSWRSFGNKSYLEFVPSGRTNYQNGTFTYCTDDSDIRKARGISVSVTGRPQIAFDRNGDGVRENSSGKALRCG